MSQPPEFVNTDPFPVHLVEESVTVVRTPAVASTTIYIVRACTFYEGETCLRAFTAQLDAVAFKAECETYNAARPEAPRECVDTPENDAEHEAWWEAERQWVAQHPGGESASFCSYFDIAELPCFGIEEASQEHLA